MKRPLVFFCVLALLGGSLPVGAADSGISYDSVAKFLPNADVATLEPGDFDADYQLASQPAAAPRGGGLLGKFSNLAATASNMGQMMRNGLAEKHYLAGYLQRTDFPSLQKADILDCKARTLTTLDLKAKTYTVTSLDSPAPAAGRSTGGSPNPSATDDGTKLAITIVNHALGPKVVSGVSTDGYASNIDILTTQANGDSSASKMAIKEYLSKTARVASACSAAGRGTDAALPGASMMQQYATMMRAMGSVKNSRFSFSSTGPSIPGGLQPMFEAVTFSGKQNGNDRTGQITVMSENAHIGSVSSSDPVFSVPPDFTKVT